VQKALLQSLDNELVITCSLEEESKVEKNKEEYDCCGIITECVITSTIQVIVVSLFFHFGLAAKK